ncbi:MAG: helix-turn-helix transcriptional regulator [Bacteroidota bacterium]
MMHKTVHLNSIRQMHQAAGLPNPAHQLVSVIYNRDIQRIDGLQGVKVINNLYLIVFKSTKSCSTFTYGINSYDYEDGTLVFTAPGQVMEFERTDPGTPREVDPEGWSLAFHPNLFRKSDLAQKIDKYSFFHYHTNEALHLSDKERHTIEELLEKITHEYSQRIDRHSQHLIVANIELFLDYCVRFYDRQFFSRTNLNVDLLSRFERLLTNYYQSEPGQQVGIPRVEDCARNMNLSPKYLSDLLKRETGKTTQEHIHYFLIEKAKSSLLNTTMAISEIGYSLGFAYPQHFSNLFKRKTGYSPSEYRNLN